MAGAAATTSDDGALGLLARRALTAGWFTLTGAPVGSPPRHSLGERAEAAQRAGFTALALSPDALLAQRAAGGSIEALIGAVGDAGLSVSDLEPLRGWDGDAVGPDASASRAAEEAMYDLAAAFGARRITVISVVGDAVSPDVLAERFGALCDRAAGHGVTVCFEPRAHSPLDTPASALALLRRAARPNAGIVLDCYHVHRSGTTLEDLRALPADVVAAIHLNDAHATSQGTPAQDALEHRLAPGDGALDVAGWLAGLDALGIDAPLAVEVLSRDAAALPVGVAAQRAADGARGALSAARAHAGRPAL